MMIKSVTFIVLGVLCWPVFAEKPVNAKIRSELTPIIDQHVQTRIDDWTTFYKDLHAHPELSMHEERSASKIAGRLKSAGYDVTARVGGFGVVGVLKNGGGPTVMIRGDMDALPITEDTGLPFASQVTVRSADGQQVGVMHACGHDVHQTCLVGTAELLAELRDRWRGTLLMVAQPAEEIGAGARMMIEDGLFDRFPKPDYCLALHVSGDLPTGSVGLVPGFALANVDSVDITVFGRGGHGSRPHETVDPVVAAAQVIVALQTVVSRRVDPLKPGVISVGSVHAGSKHNIISDEARMQITVRSYSDETRKILLDGIREVTLHTCRAMGCAKDPEIHIRDDEFTPAAYNDPNLTQIAGEVFAAVLGAENARSASPVMGGEDFGRFPKHLDVPGLIFWLGAVERGLYDASQKSGGPRLPSLHSNKFAPDAPPTISTGVRCMSSLALALLATAD